MWHLNAQFVIGNPKGGKTFLTPLHQRQQPKLFTRSMNSCILCKTWTPGIRGSRGKSRFIRLGDIFSPRLSCFVMSVSIIPGRQELDGADARLLQASMCRVF